MDAFWSLLEKYGLLVAVAASLYSAVMWIVAKRSEKRMKEPILIRLVAAEDVTRVLYELPILPTRGSVTRAEVLGLLGMIPSHRERFDWKSLITPEFMKQLEEVASFRRDVIVVAVSEDERAQIEIPTTRNSSRSAT